jgi:Spy/CpxP family protein refolding chaperone
MRVVSIVLALVVSLVFVGTLSAADQMCPTTKPAYRGHGPWGMLKGLNLTDEQKAKVKELWKEYQPKFKEATGSVLTADQKKARDNAIKAAKDAGKKGPEVFKAVRAAVKLTDEQKAKMKEAIKPLRKELHEKIKGILTPEQQEQLKAKIATHKHHGHGPWGMLKGLNLTDEQKAKVKELRKEYQPKFKEAAGSVLTTDQKKARDDAIKAAKDAGKKGPEVFKAARAAVKLTDEQKAKMKEVIKPLRKEFREKVKAILTPEQQEQLKAKIAKHKAESK